MPRMPQCRRRSRRSFGLRAARSFRAAMPSPRRHARNRVPRVARFARGAYQANGTEPGSRGPRRRRPEVGVDHGDSASAWQLSRPGRLMAGRPERLVVTAAVDESLPDTTDDLAATAHVGSHVEDAVALGLVGRRRNPAAFRPCEGLAHDRHPRALRQCAPVPVARARHVRTEADGQEEHQLSPSPRARAIGSPRLVSDRSAMGTCALIPTTRLSRAW
jgi:hypothetical protein